MTHSGGQTGDAEGVGWGARKQVTTQRNVNVMGIWGNRMWEIYIFFLQFPVTLS